MKSLTVMYSTVWGMDVSDVASNADHAPILTQSLVYRSHVINGFSFAAVEFSARDTQRIVGRIGGMPY